MKIRSVIGGMLLLGLLGGMPARADTLVSSSDIAQLGSLHRTAALLDSTLDVYRLTLSDFVPLMRLLTEIGEAPGARPETQLPPATHLALQQLATSVERRLPAASLPAIVRSYHNEVLEALSDLATATHLGQVVDPLQRLMHGMQGVGVSAGQIVDLFARERPVVTEISDPSTALDAIAEALDQLGRAEADLNTLQKRHAAPGELLHGFLRLEIALRHALDLIAAAEEAGVQLGFEMPMSTSGFSERRDRVQKRLSELQSMAARMMQPPQGAVSQILIHEMPSDKGFDVHMTWKAPTPRGRYVARAVQLWHSDTHGAWHLWAELPPGRSMHEAKLTLTEAGEVPGQYRLVAVNAFGVAGKSVERRAVRLSSELSGPTHVRAVLRDVDVFAKRFYADGDAIDIEWELSSNDPRRGADIAALLERHHLPRVALYRIAKWVGNTMINVGEVHAGENHFVDRPSDADFAQGVRYHVSSVDQAGAMSAAGTQGLSGWVRQDLSSKWRLAAAGAAQLNYPTHYAQAEMQRLRDKSHFAIAMNAFSARPEDEQNQLLKQWWESVSPIERVEWLRRWPSFVPAENRTEWLVDLLQERLSKRDAPWVQVSIWLRDNAGVYQEVEQFWQILDVASQRNAEQSFRARFAPEDRERLKAHAAQIEPLVHVQAWWAARDPQEHEKVALWWAALEPSMRAQKLKDFLQTLPEPVQISVRWPGWEQLLTAERDGLLAQAYQQLPLGLWPQALAWVRWHELQGAELENTIRSEVGWLRATLSRLHFAARPLDKRLHFHLKGLLVISALLGLLGYLLVRPPSE